MKAILATDDWSSISVLVKRAYDIQRQLEAIRFYLRTRAETFSERERSGK